MNADQAAALRKKFPKSAIGLKPQPYKKDSPKGKCDVCHGFHGMPATHLDYVGHAAVTDRLCDVDPEWTWEPFALDANGLPALDPGRNLWIKLTICGVTKPGVGDGVSIKEAIGDAIRNAAMRFGVAVDLWAKEDLDGTGEIRARVESTTDEQPATRTVRRTQPTLPRMFALLKEQGLTDRDEALRFVSGVVGQEITTRNDLTPPQIGQVVDELERRKKEAQDADKAEAGAA